MKELKSWEEFYKHTRERRKKEYCYYVCKNNHFEARNALWLLFQAEIIMIAKGFLKPEEMTV